jgi:hypothetical protein
MSKKQEEKLNWVIGSVVFVVFMVLVNVAVAIA